jgi:hypothetical protein
MEKQLLIDPGKLAIVQLRTGEFWVRLALALTRDFTGGDLVQFAEDATVSVEGADKLSSAYKHANWVTGIASGALYAFRALRIPRQHVVLTELCGRLRASDMEAVAIGSAIAIANLAGQELPPVRAEGWTIHAEVSNRSLRSSSQVSNEGKENGTPADNTIE